MVLNRGRICLIVDNPLRDVDGLTLLAWQLCRAGHEVFLVPMYEQGGDVPALMPEFVITNYVRPNNRDLLAHYRNLGARILVLDTEGAGGRTADEFAAFVKPMNCEGLVDGYFLWGEAQRGAFARAGILPPERVFVTGCPRFDFCAAPWRGALLPPPQMAPGYVLINTNFPFANPRFSASGGAEVATAVAVGFTVEHAEAMLRDARLAYGSIRELIARLARALPQVRFVVRPHPFENAGAYSDLETANLFVRQSGTSLEWLSAAVMLVHMNCSTAFEAVMLGKEPIATEWLNFDSLRQERFRRVSHVANSFDELVAFVSSFLAGVKPQPDEQLRRDRAELIEKFFGVADGNAARRTCEALACVEGLAAGEKPRASRHRVSPRARGVLAARALLGHGGLERLRRLVAGKTSVARRDSKRIDLGHVADVVARLQKLGLDGPLVRVTEVAPGVSRRPRLLSGQSVRLSAD